MTRTKRFNVEVTTITNGETISIDTETTQSKPQNPNNMERIKVTDIEGEPAGWFDPEKAYSLEEETRWNGSNQISEATGSQTEHEKLYLTASGQWILNHWSQFQGRAETYQLITQGRAVEWLLQNQYKANELEHLPKQKQDELLEALQQYEL